MTLRRTIFHDYIDGENVAMNELVRSKEHAREGEYNSPSGSNPRKNEKEGKHPT